MFLHMVLEDKDTTEVGLLLGQDTQSEQRNRTASAGSKQRSGRPPIGRPGRSETANGRAPAAPGPLASQVALMQQLEQMLAGGMTTEMEQKGAAEQLCKVYNDLSMQYMNQGQVSSAFDLLQKALALSEPLAVSSTNSEGEMVRWLVVTCNNLSCYYKRKGKPEAALMYLQRAESLLGRLDYGPGATEKSGLSTSTTTQLNLCAVLSSLGRHDDALRHAQQAHESVCSVLGLDCDAIEAAASSSPLIAASSALRPLSGQRQRPSSARSEGASSTQQICPASSASAYLPRPTSTSSIRPPVNQDQGRVSSLASTNASSRITSDTRSSGTNDRDDGGNGARAMAAEEDMLVKLRGMPSALVSMLGMSLYNRAVEFEHLGRHKEALRSYTAATWICNRILGRGTSLASTFNKSLQVRTQSCPWQ